MEAKWGRGLFKAQGVDMPQFDIKQVAENALGRIDDVLARWVPDGSYEGMEYKALNPTRADKNKGSFSINRNTGAWSEFAEGKGGSDLVALVAYIDRINQGEACQKLAVFLGMNDLNPLPLQEQPRKRTAQAKWSEVMPVPSEAVTSCPSKHYKNGLPSAVWTYLDAQGALLMKIMRFDIGKQGQRKKDYRPLTYCASDDGSNKHQWRWQQPKKSRPLYGLDRLAAKPDAPVMLTEGEKAADAATALFPDYVCMTWPGGSQALAKSDFSSLSGRRVILWPDNDEAGKDCMQKLAATLLELGCAVHLIELSAFGADWPHKADAADANAHGVTAAKLSILVSKGGLLTPYQSDSPILPALTNPSTTTRADVSSESASSRFVVSDKGVFFRSEGEDDEGLLIRVCDRLDVLALTRDNSGRNWGTLVQLTDPDGEVKNWNIPSEYLATEGGAEVLRQLFSMGLRAESGQQPRRRLIQYLQTAQTSNRYVLVNKLGWHDKAYLLPTCTLGNPKEPLYFYSNTPDLNKMGERGELEQWKKEVAAYCVGNPRLAFAISAALAAPLLHLIGMETTGFHFFGDSSQGKTTLLKMAASVYGPPGYVRTWRSTDNALESIASAHSDGLLILDEISQCDSRIVGDIAYLLGNGKGKSRANDRGGVRGNALEWRLLFLSSGEKTLEQQMAEAGKKTKAGQEIRLLAIPTDAGKKLGIFNDLHSFAGGAAFSASLVESSAKSYGTPFYAFMESLCASQLDKLSSRIRRELINFSSTLADDVSGQVCRAAEKFALVGFAGELASSAGITGWPRGMASEAARVCFDAWVSARGGVGNLEDQQILSHIKLFFEMYGESRFTRWDRDNSTVDDHNVRTINRCGFRKVMEDTNALNDANCTETNGSACSVITYYVTSEAFKSEICKGFNLKRVKVLLGECEALSRDSSGGYTIPVRLPGSGRKKQRVYVLRPHLIPGSGDEDEVEKQKAA
jgi:putative DNA primase/helicase